MIADIPLYTTLADEDVENSPGGIMTAIRDGLTQVDGHVYAIAALLEGVEGDLARLATTDHAALASVSQQSEAEVPDLMVEGARRMKAAKEQVMAVGHFAIQARLSFATALDRLSEAQGVAKWLVGSLGAEKAMEAVQAAEKALA